MTDPDSQSKRWSEAQRLVARPMRIVDVSEWRSFRDWWVDADGSN